MTLCNFLIQNLQIFMEKTCQNDTMTNIYQLSYTLVYFWLFKDCMYMSILKTALLAITCAVATSASAYIAYESDRGNETLFSQVQPTDRECVDYSILDEDKYASLKKRGNYCVKFEFRSDGRVTQQGQYAAPPIDPAQAQNNQQVAELNQKVKELEERETARRCQSLRNNLANYNMGGRIYEMDASGNKAYLNDQEIQVRRERTQQAIAQYCTGTASTT